MDKSVIGLRDREFAHAELAGCREVRRPDFDFQWDRSETWHAITVFTDSCLEQVHVCPSPHKIAWLTESPRVTRDAYRWVSRNARLFDRVLTFEQSFLESFRHAQFTPFGSTYIGESDWQVFPKTRQLSMVTSAKRDLPGHQLRHKVITKYASRFDALLGRGFHEIDRKVEGLQDFRYSIAMENCRQNYYFSEKLLDCFLTGTVPIYWGCPGIGLFFDKGGIITFEKPKELKAILDSLSDDEYSRRLPAIRRNLELAKNYVFTEAHAWENIRDLVEA